MTFSWERYIPASTTDGRMVEEGVLARWNRWEENIGRFLTEFNERDKARTVALDDIATAIKGLNLQNIAQPLDEMGEYISNLVTLAGKLGPSDKGNLLERAYALAMMQERQEIQENLKELMLGMGTIPAVIEFMAQRPELKKFYDKVVAADKLPEDE